MGNDDWFASGFGHSLFSNKAYYCMFMYVLYFCPSISVFLLAFMRVSFAFRVLSSKQMSLGKSGWVFAIITLPALQSKVRN